MGRIEYRSGGAIDRIILSERNLLTLLSKLYTPGSEATIVIHDTNRELPGDIWIKAETDDYHYNSPTRRGAAPGGMHPRTERIINAIKRAIEEDATPTGW